MPTFETVIVCEVEANSYEEAVEKTRLFRRNGERHNSDDVLPIHSYVVTDFDYDNDGQRVLYFHSEDQDMRGNNLATAEEQDERI